MAGGGEIYRAAMPFATELRVTEIDLTVDGDAFAPEIGPEWHAAAADWQTSASGLRYRFRRYLRA